MPPQPLDPQAVFLNIPYDEEFTNLYLAYIVGLYSLGLVPHLASEIPGGARRLERILGLIKGCRYSIHDLSRVEIGAKSSATLRFNMPLELGMTITWTALHPNRHTWFVCEAEPFRLQRSASDLNGMDAYIHDGFSQGVFRELRNAFRRPDAPSVAEMLKIHRSVEVKLRALILPRAGVGSAYAPAVFRELCLLCSRLTELLRIPKARQ